MKFTLANMVDGNIMKEMNSDASEVFLDYRESSLLEQLSFEGVALHQASCRTKILYLYSTPYIALSRWMGTTEMASCSIQM